jgi:glycosyltransferase involved in cell wall biosynthesis
MQQTSVLSAPELALNGHPPVSRRPLKVAMVAYTFYDKDNRVMRYAETLARRGDKVDVICLSDKPAVRTESFDGVNAFYLQERIMNEQGRFAYVYRILLFFLRAFMCLAKRDHELKYDLIHVHSVPDFLVFTALLPKIRGARVILDIHDVLPEFYASKFGKNKKSLAFNTLVLVEGLCGRFADHVIIANDIWLDRYARRSGQANKCSAILNFPDPDIFVRRGRKRNDNKVVFLYPGTLNWHQGIDIAIRAFAKVKRQLPSAEFHIYGNGSSYDLITKLIAELGLEGSVLLRDPVPLREIASIIENADVGIVPKRSDSFGDEAFSTKTLEFMSLGVPLIVSNTAIDRYYFNDSVVMFFHDGNEQELADCMLRLATDSALCKKFSQNALEFVKDFSWGTKKREYLDLVDRLVTRPGSTRSKQPVAAL